MSKTYGKTSWKRFALVMVPSVAATAAIGVGLANNALAASFAVSGQSFKVTAEDLDGKNFAQFGSFDAQVDGKPQAVAVSAFDTATIKGLCQSVVTDPSLFGLKLPKVTLRLEAGKSDDDAKKVHADNLLIDLNDLQADATFDNIVIGQDASTLKGSAINGWTDVQGHPKPSLGMGFSQAAPHAHLVGVKQTAWATSAGSFKLNGLSLHLFVGDEGNGKECY